MEKKYKNHVMFDAKGKGDCSSLCGNVVVTFVLADDSGGKWTDEEIVRFKKENYEAGRRLLAEAEGFGAKVQLFLKYVRCTVKGVLTAENCREWTRSAREAAGFPVDGSGNKYLEKIYSADEAPVMFCVSYEGRAFAVPSYSAAGFEYGALYANDGDFRHELYHLFGAKDLYYPESVKAAAEKHIGKSVMLGGGDADGLNAYLMGWTDTLGEKEIAFLDATASVTEKDVADALKEKTFTGYGTIPYGSGTYTGDLVTGFPHGRGTAIYSDGGVYTGEWNHGKLQGSGVLRYNNGAVYTGKWRNDKYHGVGTLVYSDGSVYNGDFVDGEMVGNGIRQYRNGAVYKGGFRDGHRHGYGVMVYADRGGVYDGEWVSDEIDGRGIMRYKNGAVYDGEWREGKYHGRGKLSYADGTVREGEWESGEYKGRGA